MRFFNCMQHTRGVYNMIARCRDSPADIDYEGYWLFVLLLYFMTHAAGSFDAAGCSIIL